MLAVWFRACRISLCRFVSVRVGARVAGIPLIRTSNLTPVGAPLAYHSHFATGSTMSRVWGFWILSFGLWAVAKMHEPSCRGVLGTGIELGYPEPLSP